METEKLAFTVVEAAHSIGVGRSTLYEAMASKRLAFRKLGARRLILKVDLEQFLEGLKAA